MRLIRCVLALMLAAFANRTFAQTVKLPLPESGSAVTISFASIENRGGETYRALTVVSGGRRTRFAPRHPILRIPESAEAKQQQGIWTNIPGLKLHSSRFFLVGSYTVNSHPHTLLFFLSEAGTGAAPVFVVGFSDDGQPFRVLERDELDVTSLEASQDGAFIIGKTTLSQVAGGEGGYDSKTPYATTYDPFFVFRLHPSSPATYSLDAARTYNKKHYAWAGPHARDDYAVLYNMPGHHKPLGAPASKVDSLLGLAGGK